MAVASEDIRALHDALIYAYDHDDLDNEQRDTYIDTLKLYANTVALATARTLMEMLGIDANAELLALTARQYGQLEASDMLELYIDGKDDTDD